VSVSNRFHGVSALGVPGAGFAVGAMFVREVFHGEAKTQGEIMIDNIRAAFKRNLHALDWMDAETRAAADTKADAITDMIGKFLCL
jgi:neprilysin